MTLEQSTIPLAKNDSSTRCDDATRRSRHGVRQYPGFEIPKCFLAVLFENGTNASPRGLLDGNIGVDEGHVHDPRETPTDRGLAASHEADEDDVTHPDLTERRRWRHYG
jgi:hypothetical protein